MTPICVGHAERRPEDGVFHTAAFLLQSACCEKMKMHCVYYLNTLVFILEILEDVVYRRLKREWVAKSLNNFLTTVH